MKPMTAREFTRLKIDNLNKDTADGPLFYSQDLVEAVRTFMDEVMEDERILMPSIYAEGDHQIAIEWEVDDFCLHLSMSDNEHVDASTGAPCLGFNVGAWESTALPELFDIEGAGYPPLDVIQYEALEYTKLEKSRHPNWQDRFSYECHQYVTYWRKSGALLPADVLDRTIGTDWRGEAYVMDSEWERQRVVREDMIPSAIAGGAL